jgi:hypothetical protein
VLWDLKPRAGSPDWLVRETETIRRGLLSLRQNLILIRDPSNPEVMHPRCDAGGRSCRGYACSVSPATLRLEGMVNMPRPPGSTQPHATCTHACMHACSHTHTCSRTRTRRFALSSCSSFKQLPDAGWRSALAQLHDDYFYK